MTRFLTMHERLYPEPKFLIICETFLSVIPKTYLLNILKTYFLAIFKSHLLIIPKTCLLAIYKIHLLTITRILFLTAVLKSMYLCSFLMKEYGRCLIWLPSYLIPALRDLHYPHHSNSPKNSSRETNG